MTVDHEFIDFSIQTEDINYGFELCNSCCINQYSSEASRINASELYNFLEIQIPFNQWIEDLINGYKGYLNCIVIKEPAVGKKSKTMLSYYINLRIAKIAALKAGSKPGAIAYDYLKSYQDSFAG
jgi:phage anti-repressor protein